MNHSSDNLGVPLWVGLSACTFPTVGIAPIPHAQFVFKLNFTFKIILKAIIDFQNNLGFIIR